MLYIIICKVLEFTIVSSSVSLCILRVAGRRWLVNADGFDLEPHCRCLLAVGASAPVVFHPNMNVWRPPTHRPTKCRIKIQKTHWRIGWCKTHIPMVEQFASANLWTHVLWLRERTSNVSLPAYMSGVGTCINKLVARAERTVAGERDGATRRQLRSRRPPDTLCFCTVRMWVSSPRQPDV